VRSQSKDVTIAELALVAVLRHTAAIAIGEQVEEEESKEFHNV